MMKDKLFDPADLFQGCRSLLVAFSGGADSVALLHFYEKNRAELGLDTVCAAHFNHRLRGAESDADQYFCEQFCREHGIRLFTGAGDVAQAAQQTGVSVEMAARELRYAFLRQTAAELGALIATAHHADDSLETVLLNLTRGTGLTGLCGIPPHPPGIVRPLLRCTKQQLLDYCRSQNLGYVTDSTNLEDRYARNRIRLRVIPELEKLNPSLSQTVSQMTATLSDDEDFLRRSADRLLAEARRTGFAGLPVYDVPTLAAAHPSLQSRAAVRLFADAGLTPSRAELLTVCALFTQKSGHRLIRGLHFDSCKNRLDVGFAPVTPPPAVLHKGANFWGDWCITLEISPENQKSEKFPFISSLSYDKIRDNLVVRGRKEGDSCSLTGAGGTKTLKKLFNEYAVPVRLRGCVPILCSGDDIVTVAGIGTAGSAACGSDCRVLTLAISCPSPAHFPGNEIMKGQVV